MSYDATLLLTFQEIVEAVLDNDIVIITGATGCGKSTQVPQFLYEAGFCGIDNSCLIGITQPRRVAVTSLTSRVGVELNDPSLCGYQVRRCSALREFSGRQKLLFVCTTGEGKTGRSSSIAMTPVFR